VTLRQQDGAGERESRASVVDRAVALPSLPRGAQGILLCATPGGGQRDLVGTANGSGSTNPPRRWPTGSAC
jgi:hypothetical protein